MPPLCVVIPPSLDMALRDAPSACGTSTDSLVSAALSEYFDSQHVPDFHFNGLGRRCLPGRHLVEGAL
jgi:hypothetical protein